MTEAGDRQRIDKWLWFARMARTRTLAARLVTAGHVRVNGGRAEDAARPVRVGDVLTIAIARDTRVVAIRALGARRGPSAEARLLFEDLSKPRDDASLAQGGESR